MVEHNEVFRAADRLRVAGKRVSVRNVRKQLPRGGSYSDVGPAVARWKVEQKYQPRIEMASLPEALQGKLLDFGMSVWSEAMREATSTFADQRDKLELERLAHEGITEEALASADGLEEQVSLMRQEIAYLRAEKDRLRGHVPAEPEDEVPTTRMHGEELKAAQEFWDRLIPEIEASLETPSTAQQILIRISSAPMSDALERGVRLTPSLITKKMDVRVEHGRYFAKHEGFYRRIGDLVQQQSGTQNALLELMEKTKARLAAEAAVQAPLRKGRGLSPIPPDKKGR